MSEKLTTAQTALLEAIFEQGSMRADDAPGKTRASLTRRRYLATYNGWVVLGPWGELWAREREMTAQIEAERARLKLLAPEQLPGLEGEEDDDDDEPEAAAPLAPEPKPTPRPKPAIPDPTAKGNGAPEPPAKPKPPAAPEVPR